MSSRRASVPAADSAAWQPEPPKTRTGESSPHDATNDTAAMSVAALVSPPDDPSHEMATAHLDHDRPLAQAIASAIIAGFCVGTKVLISELGSEPARDLLTRSVPRSIADGAPGSSPELAPAVAEVMSADETAVFLGVDRNTIYDAAARGEIPHQRLGKRLLFSRAQLVSWLGACKAARVGNG